KCGACHTGEPQTEPVSKPNFVDYYPETQKNSVYGGKVFERIKIRAVDLGTMPQGGSLSDYEKSLISSWVAAGAAEK
ncbi:MAG: hypothetical protein FJ088_04825, partial [Deltaproteobacteria bacterium]|nr:hypothetical protein [Deltaproteobacteria bacterium]